VPKTKILYIHHAAGWGGAPINMINIIKNLDKTKFEPHVLLLKDSIVKDRLAESNIEYTICNSYFYKKYYTYFSHSDAGLIKPYQIIKLFKCFFSWYLSKYIYAPKVLKNYSYDIIQLNSSVLSDWLYPASKKGKVIYHIQEPISKGYFGFRYQFIRSEVAKYADKVIAISKDNANRINLPNKTEIVYNFAEIPQILNSTVGDKSILYVGGAAKIKGIEVLIDAIPLINSDIKIFMAGSFPNSKPLGFIKKMAYRIIYPSAFQLRNKIVGLSEFKNVFFVGLVSDIKEELQKCSVLISPFTVPHFSRPVIEAFAYGKPVIASDVVGMEEVVEDEITGLLFKNGDVKAFGQAVNNLVYDFDRLKKMGENGRQKAIEYYSPEPNMKIIERVYTELMREKVNKV
jgi:glycosyltransferase involved in cell wall biosynthesis